MGLNIDYEGQLMGKKRLSVEVMKKLIRLKHLYMDTQCDTELLFTITYGGNNKWSNEFSGRTLREETLGAT